MEKVILVSGKAQHGKDTIASYLKEIMESEGKRVFIIHYADQLKLMARQVYDWNGEKDKYGRTLLQVTGDTVRAKNPLYFVEKVIEVIDIFKNDFDYVIVPDTRFPNEITDISKVFPTCSIRINRDFINPLMTEEQRNHPSETALDDYGFDLTVETTDLNSVYNKAAVISRLFISTENKEKVS